MQPLIGFTVKSQVSAKCPRGHSKWLTIILDVSPTDNFNADDYTESFKVNLTAAYDDLLKHGCETCSQVIRTKWS